MKTNHKHRIASPYQMTREKTFRMRDKSPIQEDIEKIPEHSTLLSM